MTLFYESERRQCLPPRPLQLQSVAPSDQLVFAEPTSAMRRKTKGSDKWRNTGGKNAVVCFPVPPNLIAGGQQAGLYVARRTGKIRRPGQADLTYHQFNIDESEFPEARSGTVTLYHILPASATKIVNRKGQKGAKGAANKISDRPTTSSGNRRARDGASDRSRSKPQTKSRSTTRASDDPASQEPDKDAFGRPVLDFGHLTSAGKLEDSNHRIWPSDVDNDGKLPTGADADARKRRRILSQLLQSVVLSAGVVACVALALSAGSRGSEDAGGLPGESNADAPAPDGCFGNLLPNAKRWPARCRDAQVRETCSSNQFGRLVERPGCSLWCDAGFEPVGSLCCGPDGQYGNRGAARCVQCQTGYWSDGARPCQACTDCEQQHGSFAVQNCSQTEDAKCHSYWKEMENSYPEMNQSASSMWHLPRDFVTWSDGASLFAFGGAASSLPEDTTTATMCVPPALNVKRTLTQDSLQLGEFFESHKPFPAGMAVGEAQLTNELWQLQLHSEQMSLVTMEFEAQSAREGVIFEPMCNTHQAKTAKTAALCNAAGKGCVWNDAVSGGSRPSGTCSYNEWASIAIIQAIDANAGYPPHPKIAEATAGARYGELLHPDTSRRVTEGWALGAVSGVPTANLTFDEQMVMIAEATSRAEAGDKLTLSFTDDP